MRHGPTSLRTRLVVLFTAGSAAVLLGAAAFLFVAIDRALLTEVDNGLQARAADLEASFESTGRLPAEDPFAEVIDGQGKIVTFSPPDRRAVPLLTTEQRQQIQSTNTATFFESAIPDFGGDSRVHVSTMDVNGQRMLLVVGGSLEQYTRTRQRLLFVLAIGGPILVGMSAGAGWVLAGAALRPVQRMAREADTISITHLDRRLEVPGGNDEIAMLGRTLNAMLERVESAVDHERRFIDDASHELRTPIAILRGELELALARPGDHEEMVAALQSALDEAERLSRLANDLLVLARAGSEAPPVAGESLDVRDRVTRLVGQLSMTGGGPPVNVIGGSPEWRGDRIRFDQIIMNLLDNARRHAASRVIVDIADDDQTVRITVSDDGPGFGSSMLPVTFARFVRSDPSRARDTGGTGLGLAITAESVRALGGSIEAGNHADDGQDQRGAWVRVSFPQSSD